MKKKFYHIHLWAINGFDSQTQIVPTSNNIIVGDIGLEIDSLPLDTMFHVATHIFVTERLKMGLKEKFNSDTITYEPIQRVSKGSNLIAAHPDLDIREKYFRFICLGQPAVCHFGIWDDKYMVVSEYALTFLRANGVVKAEANLIPDNKIENYFNSIQKFFWMSENARALFAKMEKLSDI